MVTIAFFLERRNAVRPITMLKTIGPKKKEKIDTTSGLTVVGSKATTSRSLSRQRIARTKFSKMEYINGPVRITKMFLQYKARINPKVITKRPKSQVQVQKPRILVSRILRGHRGEECEENRRVHPESFFSLFANSIACPR